MTKRWHALFEILRFPLEVIFFAYILLGIGNLIVNPVFGISAYSDYDALILIGEILQRTGSFLIVNFPLLFLIRLVARRSGSSVTIMSAFAGFIVFNVTTMFVADPDLTSTAYSSILGLSITRTSVSSLTGGTHYPLQTGMIGVIVIGIITMFSFSRSRKKREYGFFSFVTREETCVVLTVFLSLLAGVGFSYLWPYVIKAVNKIVSYIAKDTNDPVNLILYGILDRLFGVMNLGTLIRQPFWYTVSGGSWVSVAGANVTGDVNVWTSQVEANAVSGLSGRFITPYYILNLFAMPGMIWAMHSLNTDKKEKRRTRFLCITATIVSLLSGCLMPMELLLLILCPLLFCMHLGVTGILYGVLLSLNISLGFRSTETSTITALPGTLPEFLSYLNVPGLRGTLIRMLIIGVIVLFLYYLMTRFYFKNLAVGFLDVRKRESLVEDTLKALGGTENIRSTDCSFSELKVSLYEPDQIDVEALRKLGSFRVYESKDSYHLCFENASVMIRDGIRNAMRESIRDTQ